MNLTNFFQTKFMVALSETIIHSLWQGLALSVLLFVILLFVNKENAKLRFALSYVFMILMTVVSIITLLSSYSESEAKEAQPVIRVAEISTIHSDDKSVIEIGKEKLGSFFYSTINQLDKFSQKNFNYVFGFWILGVLFLTLRISAGFFYAQQIKYKNTIPLPSQWVDKINQIAKKLNVNRAIKAFESRQIIQPIIIGHVKPFLLLPIGMITGMPQDQIEAILVHEIAHIKRSDYMLNLFQSIIEILFFFNPAVWWFSHIVQVEREYACDFKAQEYCADKDSLSYALLGVEEAKLNFALLNVGLAKNKKLILRRIQRMKDHDKTYWNSQQRLFAIIVMLSVFSVALLLSRPFENIGINATEVSNRNVNYASLGSSFSTIEPNSSSEVQIELASRLSKENDNAANAEIHDTTKKHNDKSLVKHKHEISFDADLQHLQNFNVEFDEEKFEESMARLGEELDKLKDMKFNFDFDFNFDELSQSLPFSSEDSAEFHKEMEKVKEELASLKEMKIEIDWNKDEFKEAMKELKEGMKLHKREMLNLKTNMKDFKEEMAGLDGFLKVVKEELARDGYIDKPNEDVNLEFSKEKMKVNGQTVDAWNHEKYLKIYKNHFGKELKENINIHNK